MKAPTRCLAILAVVIQSGCQALAQVACIPSADSRRFLSELMGESVVQTPTRSSIAYAIGGRSRQADLYQPIEPSQAGIVVVPGAVQAGKDDPRLVAFANALARRRFAVLVPDLPSVRELRMTPEGAHDVADAFAYLASRPDLAPEGRAGMAGISYAFGPAMLASLEPRIRAQVRFLLGIGPYYDLEQVLTYLTTGYFQEAGSWRYLKPSAYGKWLFVLSNVEHFRDPEDRETLRVMAGRLASAPDTDVTDLAGQLKSDEGQALMALLNNSDPERVPALVARLPATLRADLAGLTLANKDLTGLQARLIIVHGTHDGLVPYTESLALAQARPGRTRLFIVNGLSHVDFQQPGFWDAWGLGCAANELLAERDRGP